MIHESEEYHVKVTPLRGYLLANKLENMCYVIAQHFINVTMDKINLNRMIMSFKLDAND